MRKFLKQARFNQWVVGYDAGYRQGNADQKRRIVKAFTHAESHAGVQPYFWSLTEILSIIDSAERPKQ